MKKHYYQLDAIKGIAIFLVILGHAIIYFPINLHTVYWCEILYDLIYSFHMPLFFAVSGFCFHYDKYSTYNQFLLKKFKRILLPYFIFSIFDMLPRLLLTGLINRPDVSWKDSLIKMFLYGGQYWFLYVLFLIFVIFPLVSKGIDKYRGLFLIGVIFFLSTIYSVLPEIFKLRSVAYYMIFFSMGFWLKHQIEYEKDTFVSKRRYIVSLSSLCGVILLWLIFFLLKSNYEWIKILDAVLGSLVVVIGVLLMNRNAIILYMEKLGGVLITTIFTEWFYFGSIASHHFKSYHYAYSCNSFQFVF